MRFRCCLASITIAFAFAIGNANAYESTVFYTVGHQDDWQLFMSPNAYRDAQSADVKVVFLYMTAGDAGRGTNPAEAGRLAYYRARDLGAEAAMRFIATPAGEFRADSSWRLVFANRHLLTRWQYNNVVAYYFHLPDGFPGGGGHPNTGWQSMQRLRFGEIPTITDIHGRNTYSGWDDLVATARSIVQSEAIGTPNVWVNVPFPNADPGNGAVLPTEDHSDHINSGRLMLDAVSNFPCINSARFYGYQTGHWDSNLNEADLIAAAATWGATVGGLLQSNGARSSFEPGHNKWVAKRYLIVANGDGACNFTGPVVVEFPRLFDGDRFRLPRRIPGLDLRRLFPGPIEEP